MDRVPRLHALQCQRRGSVGGLQVELEWGVADVEYLFLKGWRKVTFPTSSVSYTVLSCGLRAGDGPSDGTVLPPLLRPCAPFIKLLSSPQLSLHLLFVLLGLTCAQLRA